MNRKIIGQSTLDFVLVFIAIALLTVGIVRIWIWFNTNYASRETSYQQSRISAGTVKQVPETAYSQPENIGASLEDRTAVYYPLDLTDDWVFGGSPSGTVSFSGVGGPPSETLTVYCQTKCIDEGHLDCGTLDEFNFECPCYLQCICQANIQPTIDAYNAQIEGMCGEDMNCAACNAGWCQDRSDPNAYPECTGQACSMRIAAESMREAAEECDDPWELCWWGDWGATPKEMRNTADELDQQAAQIEEQGQEIQEKVAQTQACCQETTIPAQEACLAVIEEQGCEQIVNSMTDYFEDQIDDIENQMGENDDVISEINDNVTECNNEAHIYCDNMCTTECNEECVEPCENQCHNQCYSECQEWVPFPLPGHWELNQECYDNCYASCYPACYQPCFDSCYDECYPPCYEERRNACCQQFCCDEDGDCCRVGELWCFCPTWERSCDIPTTGCDEDCFEQSPYAYCCAPGNEPITGYPLECPEGQTVIPCPPVQVINPCPECGLTELAGRLSSENEELTAQIAELEAQIASLDDCCELETYPEQLECINEITGGSPGGEGGEGGEGGASLEKEIEE